MKNCSCLVVDDEKLLLTLFKLVFNQLISCDPFMVQDVPEAIYVIDNFRPKLILVDFFLGGRTCKKILEHLETIKDYHPTVYILSAAAKRLTENMKYPVISKPFDLEIIEHIIIDNKVI